MKNLMLLIAFFSAGTAFMTLNHPTDNAAPDFRKRYTGEFICTTKTYTCTNGRDTVMSGQSVETIRINYLPGDSVLIDMRPYTDAKKYAAVRIGDKRMVAVDEKGNFILNIPKGITYEKGRFIGSDALEYQHWNHHHSGKVNGTIMTARRVATKATP